MWCHIVYQTDPTFWQILPLSVRIVAVSGSSETSAHFYMSTRRHIPVNARFSAPVQIGPGAHPTSYTTGTGSLPAAQQQGRGVDYSSPSSARVEERVELYICSPSRPSWPVLGWSLPLPFTELPPVRSALQSCYHQVLLAVAVFQQ